VKKSFNIQELFAPQVQKCHGTKPMPLLLVKSFPKTPRTRSEASLLFGGSHNYNTKQNKTNYLPS
jgi:hypothetical protein